MLTIMMQWSNLTKCGLFFNIVSPAVQTFHPSVLQRLDSCSIPGWYISSHPDPRKRSSTPDMTSSSVRYCFPAKCFNHTGKQKYSQMVPNPENMEGDPP